MALAPCHLTSIGEGPYSRRSGPDTLNRMPFDSITTAAVAEDLDARLLGGRVDKIVQPGTSIAAAHLGATESTSGWCSRRTPSSRAPSAPRPSRPTSSPSQLLRDAAPKIPGGRAAAGGPAAGGGPRGASALPRRIGRDDADRRDHGQVQQYHPGGSRDGGARRGQACAARGEPRPGHPAAPPLPDAAAPDAAAPAPGPPQARPAARHRPAIWPWPWRPAIRRGRSGRRCSIWWMASARRWRARPPSWPPARWTRRWAATTIWQQPGCWR